MTLFEKTSEPLFTQQVSVPRTVAQVIAPDELADDLALLSVDGIGPITYAKLCQRFGTAAAVLRGSPSEWRKVEGVGARVADALTALASAKEPASINELLALCLRESITLISMRDSRYPPRLRSIPAPPPILYVRGDVTAMTRCPLLAMVGTRRASAYGLAQSGHFAAEATRAGMIVVSGLAHGIDAASHRGALDAGGETVAVLGGGVLNVTPPDHRSLAETIITRGCLVSEYPPFHEPSRGTFPQRNRIVSGLSVGVLIVEAPVQSGALITARLAQQHGRPVFAIPGGVDSDYARGCHALLRQGATLVESVGDILAKLSPAQQQTQQIPRKLKPPVAPPESQHSQVSHELSVLSPNERAVYDAIGEATSSVDEIITATGLGVGSVLAAVSRLELRHLIRRGESNLLRRY